MAWLIALGAILVGAAPDHCLKNGWWVLLVTGVQLTLMTLYLPFLRPRYLAYLEETGLKKWCEDNPILPTGDLVLSLLALYFTGAWDSPFYHYALTSVLAPSLKYGLRGALVASGGFCGGFVVVVSLSDSGWSAAYDSRGHLETGLVATPFEPLMIGLFAALLAEVLDRLSQEKAKAHRLAAQEERNRLAREIHDGVAQTLFMLNLSLEGCVALADKEKAHGTRDRLNTLLPISRQALLEIRNSMFDLGPLLEGDRPLRKAFEGLLREFQTVSRMEVQLTVEGEEPELSSSQRLALYRIVQEGLANACKHSQAKLVDLQVKFQPDAVRLQLSDDGRGFDCGGAGEGHGLKNMTSRAREVQAELKVESQPGEGTRIALVLSRKEG